MDMDIIIFFISRNCRGFLNEYFKPNLVLIDFLNNYSSGKCQIIHWRQGHKQECQQRGNSLNTSNTESSIADSMLEESINGPTLGPNAKSFTEVNLDALSALSQGEAKIARKVQVVTNK